MADAADILKGQTAVVTGSSSGIGRSIARELAGAGAHVLVHARWNGHDAEEVALHARSLGRDTTVVLADLSDPASRIDLVEVLGSGGRSTFGSTMPGPMCSRARRPIGRLRISSPRFGKLMWSPRYGCRVLRRKRMRATRPWRDSEHGLGPGSQTGMAGDSGELFAAIKGAVMAATRSLAKSLAPQVRVNCLAPGWIRTEWGEQASADWQDRAQRESLLARWGEPEDVARVACFLASPAAEFHQRSNYSNQRREREGE